jgi:hypothetical protein
MSKTISEDTREAIDRAEPNFEREAGFTIEQPPAPTAPTEKRKGGPGRGHKGPTSGKSHKKKQPAAPAIASSPTPAVPPEETPKALVNGCRWMLRNVVTIMKEGYGWEEPEDYQEWLIEASQLGAKCVQKHFPDWMETWGDEILFLAMLMLWATPNVSKQLREREKPHPGDAGTEGKWKDNAALPVAVPA